jgi:hypothetical protein
VLHVHVGAAARVRDRAGARAAGAGDLSGALHQLLKPLVVDREALLREQLLGHLVGEAERVVQLEGVLGGDPGGLVRLGPLDHIREQPLALRERAAEALLLGTGPALDGGPLPLELAIGLLHRVADALAQAHEEWLVDPQHVALLDRPAHDAT